MGGLQFLNGKMECNFIGELVHSVIHESVESSDKLELPEFIVMPNHIHGIIRIVDLNDKEGLINPTPTLGSFIRQYKSRCTHKIKLMGTSINKLWQRNYHEHIIRDEKTYLQIAEYIQTNPQKWTDDVYYASGRNLQGFNSLNPK